MLLDPSTPVLVGAAAVQQRDDEYTAAREPVALMTAAAERAAVDAGARALLDRVSSIRIPRGFWDYPDPGRIVAERLGIAHPHTQVTEIGVLQTTLFGLAADSIARGEDDVVLVCGAEARHRARQATRAGVVASMTSQGDVAPDSVLRPQHEIISDVEAGHGILMPVAHYAIMENSLRHADGQSLAAHRAEVAALWASFSRVAAGNPDAWSRNAVAADAIATPQGRNTMLAFPYTKLHNSQWNVDQGAALLLCSVSTARALGIEESRWIFPLAIADSNHMVPLSERAVMHRSPGFEQAGRVVLEHAETTIDDVRHLELYSCFPVAVRAQARALRVSADRALTVTGGMAFAGGPLNNFVLQAMAKMTSVLRADPGARGLVTAVSGMLTKQGVSLLSTRPPARPFRFFDVSDEARRATERVPASGTYSGPATVASYTVVHEVDGTRRGVLVCDTPDGTRAVTSTGDDALTDSMEREEWCGRPVRILADGVAPV